MQPASPLRDGRRMAGRTLARRPSTDLTSPTPLRSAFRQLGIPHRRSPCKPGSAAWRPSLGEVLQEPLGRCRRRARHARREPFGERRASSPRAAGAKSARRPRKLRTAPSSSGVTAETSQDSRSDGRSRAQCRAAARAGSRATSVPAARSPSRWLSRVIRSQDRRDVGRRDALDKPDQVADRARPQRDRGAVGEHHPHPERALARGAPGGQDLEQHVVDDEGEEHAEA